MTLGEATRVRERDASVVDFPIPKRQRGSALQEPGDGHDLRQLPASGVGGGEPPPEGLDTRD